MFVCLFCILDVVCKWDLCVFYIFDWKKILFDKDQLKFKYCWYEVYEVGYSFLFWYVGVMMGDNEYIFIYFCYEKFEVEVNFVVGCLFFL